MSLMHWASKNGEKTLGIVVFLQKSFEIYFEILQEFIILVMQLQSYDDPGGENFDLFFYPADLFLRHFVA